MSSFLVGDGAMVPAGARAESSPRAWDPSASITEAQGPSVLTESYVR